MFKQKIAKIDTVQTLNNQLLSFIARQISILKQIGAGLFNTDKSVSQSRLQECVHVLQKKILFEVSENPEQYHDYIQDFYQNQLCNLRTQNSRLKMENSLKIRQIQEMNNDLQIIKNQASERSSQEDKHFNYQQFYRLQKQIDHSKLLISQNNKLLTEQNNTIKSLSDQVKIAAKENKKNRKNYQQKILSFNQFADSNKQKFSYYFLQLQNSQRISEQKIKQMSLNTLRTMENSNLLNAQLEIKIEEIRLLTKKVFQSDMLANKLQRSVAIKDKAIQQLQQQIENIMCDVHQGKSKFDDYKSKTFEKQCQINKLQERISLLNSTNTSIQQQLIARQSKIQNLERQVKQAKHKKDCEIKNRETLQQQVERLHVEIRQKNEILERLKYQNQNNTGKIQQLNTKLKQILQKTKSEKQSMKKSIMNEVSQLISINQTHKLTIDKLQKQALEGKKAYTKLNEINCNVEQKFNTIAQAMEDITEKIKTLQIQNKQTFDAKNVLEQENNARVRQVERLLIYEQKYNETKSENQRLLKYMKQHQQGNDEQGKKRMSELQETVSNLEEQLKNNREIICKKDFQSRQLESRIKILQEDLRNISMLYQNQKVKMGKKIRQLEQLLKEDMTSRKSKSGIPVH